MSTPYDRLKAAGIKFPGLLPAEALIFNAWQNLHIREYDYFAFNVRIGAGVDPGPSWPQNVRQMAIDNSKKRVDAVGYQGTTPTLVEVKQRAKLNALGQIVGYGVLWPREHPQDSQPRLLIVTDRPSADLEPICKSVGVGLEVVPVDLGDLAH